MFVVLGSSPSPELLSHGPLLECKPCAHDNLVFWSIRSPGLITRPRMGLSLGFVTDVFYFLCTALLHIMVCSIAPLDL